MEKGNSMKPSPDLPPNYRPSIDGLGSENSSSFDVAGRESAGGTSLQSGSWLRTDAVWDAIARGLDSSQGSSSEREASCCTSAWRFVSRAVSTTAQVVRQDPVVLLSAFLSFAIIAIVGIVASNRGVNNEVDMALGRAEELATATLDYFETVLFKAGLPAVTLATFVRDAYRRDQGLWDYGPRLQEVAANIYAQMPDADVLTVLETAPGGIVTSIYGSTPDSRGPHPFKGYDINGLDTAAALSAINRRAMTLAGPFNLSAEYYKAGLYAGIKVRFPVFIPNAQSTNASDPWATPGYGYDQPFGLLNATTGKYKFSSLRPSKCSSDCRTQQDWFWGFSVAMLDLNAIERNSGLRDLYAEGYEYRLYYTSPSNITFLIAGHDCQTGGSCWAQATTLPKLDSHVSAKRTIMDTAWRLEIESKGGWRPIWEWPLYTAVLLAALLIGLLTLLLLKSQRQHLWLLAKMLPKKVIKKLAKGERYIESFDTVAVLFSDIVSYTTMASQMRPADIVIMLNTVYQVYDRLVEETGCYKVETIGDGFVAVAGTPDRCSPAEAAEKIARLALRMVEETNKLDIDPKIRIRVGIHCGPVVAAVVGESMPHFSLFGDTVNTASRMESNSVANRINVSEATRVLLERGGLRWMLESRGAADVKGKGRMTMYYLNGLLSEAKVNGEAPHAKAEV